VVTISDLLLMGTI